MRLYLAEDENGDKEYLEVSVWSFMKCMFLTHLLFLVVFWGGLIVLSFIIGLIIGFAGY